MSAWVLVIYFSLYGHSGAAVTIDMQSYGACKDARENVLKESAVRNAFCVQRRNDK